LDAKDTLMTFKEQTEEMKTAKVKPGCLVRKQAEITWDIAFKAGINEVVKWMESYYSGLLDHSSGINKYLIPRKEREAKLKDWGLE